MELPIKLIRNFGKRYSSQILRFCNEKKQDKVESNKLFAYLVDTQPKLNEHEIITSGPRRHMDVLVGFNLGCVST